MVKTAQTRTVANASPCRLACVVSSSPATCFLIIVTPSILAATAIRLGGSNLIRLVFRHAKRFGHCGRDVNVTSRGQRNGAGETIGHD